ncbi:hypothetical protein NV379_04895 [Paenibacillus sp. N1-5-1-14]|uniref:hypothetical protein n=1 Tax=Paenibacillus radicibacter TaxID=2972488 RepID=UPI0021594C4A|nr:hypothetical protein [Paenibacillus radicibacter]MCR8641987.1 hypothetical protein [Paenibacillus radicibacter]
MKRLIVGTIVIAIILAALIGLFLYRNGYFNENISRREIQSSDIPNILLVKVMPVIPDWEIDKIVEYNDHFTLPTCTIHFTNGLQLLLSRSPMQFKEMDQTLTTIGNTTYTLFSNNQNKVYQYNTGMLYYSFQTTRGPNEEVIEAYLRTKSSK